MQEPGVLFSDAKGDWKPKGQRDGHLVLQDSAETSGHIPEAGVTVDEGPSKSLRSGLSW